MIARLKRSCIIPNTDTARAQILILLLAAPRRIRYSSLRMSSPVASSKPISWYHLHRARHSRTTAMPECDPPLPQPYLLALRNNQQSLTRVDAKSRRHEVKCDLCHEWIRLAGRENVPNPAAFYQHRGSKRCNQNKQRLERQQATLALQSLPEHGQPPPTAALEQTPQAETEISDIEGQQGNTPAFPLVRFLSTANLKDQILTPRQTPARPPLPDIQMSLITAPHRANREEHHPKTLLPLQPLLPLAGSDPTPVQEGLDPGSDTSDDVGLDSPTPMPSDCQGILVHWTPGSVWETYPFHRHQTHTLGWELVAIKNGSWLQFRAVQCSRYVENQGEVRCSACDRIPHTKEYIKFVERADGDAPETTPYPYLTHKQLHAVTVKLAARVRRLELQVSIQFSWDSIFVIASHQTFNQRKHVSRQRRKINDHQRLTMLLATHDVKRLRQTLAVSLRRGSSPRYLMSKLDRAIAGLYNARGPGGGFSQRELHVALLAKAHGGPRLLYALNKSHGLPSLGAVNASFDVPCLLPSIRVPTTQDTHINADSFLAPHIKPAAPVYGSLNKRTGVEVMADDVALDEKGCYIPKFDAIGGICRQHVAKIRVSGIKELTHVESVANSIDAGQCHFGKDATVVAIAPYGRANHYGATPLLASPTCKSEDGISLSIWLNAFIQGYNTHKYGRAQQGPIWALASNGEASFRKAKFELCMTQTIPRNSELGMHLYQMTGMNVGCGEDGIIATCDPKHVFKRRFRM